MDLDYITTDWNRNRNASIDQVKYNLLIKLFSLNRLGTR